ncbi:lysostaphin resistance A-like protein [Planctomycetota bacterium]
MIDVWIDVFCLPLILLSAQLLAAFAIVPMRIDRQAKFMLLFGLTYFAVGLVFCHWFLGYRELSWRDIGFNTSGLAGLAATGLGAGVFCVAMFCGFHYLFHFLKIDTSNTDRKLKELVGDTPQSMYAFMLVAILGGGILEEVMFRGIMITRLLALAGPDPGIKATAWIIAIPSLLFGAAHYPMMGLPGFIVTAVAGAVLGGLFLTTGNLFPVMLAHVLVNGIMVYFIYYGVLDFAGRECQKTDDRHPDSDN